MQQIVLLLNYCQQKTWHLIEETFQWEVGSLELLRLGTCKPLLYYTQV